MRLFLLTVLQDFLTVLQDLKKLSDNPTEAPIPKQG